MGLFFNNYFVIISFTLVDTKFSWSIFEKNFFKKKVQDEKNLAV